MSSEPHPPSGRILLVDDEAAVIHITRRILEIGGYSVTGVLSSIEALHLIEPGSWDAVITDRQMPIMDGEELANQIHQRSPKTPILLITGYPESVIRPERFFAILKKPFTATELFTQVSRMLGRTAA